MLSIADIINYRLTHENLIEEVSSTLPLEGLGQFEVTSVRDVISGIEHLVLYKDPKLHTEPPLVRVHSSCQTGDIVRSQRCDCYQQLQYSLKILSEQGGLLIYLQQEGRGIGLFNKIRAYALQDQGMDTVAANIELGFPCDLREYNIAANVLRNRGLRSIRLLTNNPAKVEGMQKFGIEEVEVVPMPVFCNGHNRRYLQTKKEVLGHTINRGL